MPKPDKKQRHKAKRQAKKRDARRRDSTSPLKRLAEADGELECWTSTDFEGFGQVELLVYKRAAGQCAIAGFLVDRGVVGLKDAWVRLRADHAEFEDAIRVSKEQGIPMTRTTPDEVRRRVAGGLRWAHENGMRLPADWAKAASLVGGVGDWATADVSAFAKEFAGHPDDLRRRLVREPFEDYVRRPDVQFDFDEDAPYLDEETGDYLNDEDAEEDLEAAGGDLAGLEEELAALEEGFEPAAGALVKETSSWLSARGVVRAAELPQAWMAMLLSAAASAAGQPDAPEPDVVALTSTMLESIAAHLDPSRVEGFRAALGQIHDHAAADPSVMQRVLQKHGPTLPPEDGDDEDEDDDDDDHA